jgi:tetratricopeptide (TPR) repeat protein
MTYAPIAQFIRESLSGPRGTAVDLGLPDTVMADLITLAPDLRPDYPNIPPNPRLDPQSEQQRLFDSVVALCDALTQAAQTPLLLLVEDLHWADSGTLFLLRHLARRSRAANLRLLSVMTYRDAEAELEDARALKDVLLDLNRERLAEQIRLPRLNREQTRELLAAMLANGGEISTDFLDGIFSETEGNPFFVEEVCKALIEEGKLYHAGGRWRRTDIANIVIPHSVRETILSRVERLPSPSQDTLRLAAIIGREFDLDTLKTAGDVDEETLVPALERAEQAQLIHGARYAGRLIFTFAHALIPFTLRENLSGLGRQRLHRRVAEVIEVQHPGNFEALAYHFAAAGERAKAIEYTRRAALRAEAMYAYEGAMQHLRAAIDLLEVEEDVETRLEVLEALADIHSLLGQGTQAVPLYQEALDLWPSAIHSDKWLAVRLHRKIGEAATSMNRFADYQRLAAASRANLETGLKLTAGEPPQPETVRLLRTLSRDAWYSGVAVDWEAAERYARAAVAMAEDLDEPVELSSALEALADVYGARGQLRKRVEVCLKRLALSRDARFADLRERANILLQMGIALSDVGEYRQALPHLLEAESLASQMQDVTKQADALTGQGGCLFRLDRWDDLLEIEDKLQRLQTRYAFERMGVQVCFYIALNAGVHALRGDLDRAHTRREEAYQFMTAVGGPPEQWFRNQHR